MHPKPPSTKPGTFLTGITSGRVYSYDVAEGEAVVLAGTNHSAYVAKSSPEDTVDWYSEQLSDGMIQCEQSPGSDCKTRIVNNAILV